MIDVKQYLPFSLIFTVILFSGCHHTDVTYWESGLKKTEFSYRGKQYEGISTWWYPNGNKQMEANYHNNLLDGKTTRWFYSGGVESVAHFEKDRKNGLSSTFDESGHKLTEETYRNDTLHGPYTAWFPNGQIRIAGFFDRGSYDSTWVYFNEYGIRIGEGKYIDGTGTQKGFHPNGRLMREITYVNNKKHGEEIWFDQKGNPERILVYKNGEFLKEKPLK
jgi:antitoxin component YwqK of YwqJK toxin-antitoxin module